MVTYLSLSSIKEKLFSTAGVFVLILLGILATFLISNRERILTNLGYETRTVLKTKLAKTEEELMHYKNTNKDLVDQIENLKKENDKIYNNIINYCNDINNTHKKVEDNINEHNRKTNTIIYKLGKNSYKTNKIHKNNQSILNKNTDIVNVIDNNHTEVDKEELEEKLASENIELLNKVYSELFSS